MKLAISLEHEQCKGCLLCVHVCPRGALAKSERQNAQGYEYVTVDQGACIGCGVCYLVCPDCVLLLKEVGIDG